MVLLDKRLHAYRDDLADHRLQGQVKSTCFVEGHEAMIKQDLADIYDAPSAQAGLQSQILYGHKVTVFEEKNGWAWIQRCADGYVGYIRANTLAENPLNASHMVLSPRSFLYPSADMKAPRCGSVSMGSKLVVDGQKTTRGTQYYILKTGEAIIADHVIELGNWQKDQIHLAHTLLHTPYLWGGDTGFGIDCSGLVYLTAMLCGKDIMRDSDMQAKSLGRPLKGDLNDLQRGDLVFWQGHVGLMADNQMLIHANGHTMDVSLEKLSDAVQRISYLYGAPTQLRRMI